MSTDEGGWRWQTAIIRKAFPGIQITSAFRNNSVAAGGGLDYHSRGRAIDLPPMPSVFDWIAKNYPQTEELIFSPENNRQIKNGQPHLYGEPTRSGHFSHVHWAIVGGVKPDGSDGPQPGQGGASTYAGATGSGSAGGEAQSVLDDVKASVGAFMVRAAVLLLGGFCIYEGLKRMGVDMEMGAKVAKWMPSQ